MDQIGLTGRASADVMLLAAGERAMLPAQGEDGLEKVLGVVLAAPPASA